MKYIKGQFSLNQLQALVWAGVWLIVFLSLLAEDGFYQAFSFAIVNVGFYALIIYGNIAFLFPFLYKKGKKFIYLLIAPLFVAFCGVMRGLIIISLYNRFFAIKPREFSVPTFINFISAAFLIYMLSFIFRIAIAYFTLKQQSEKILAQKSQAELELLKNQVQPHFLFNTLNNIYFKAYQEAPETALLLGKLADIMRYFVEESNKEMVSLKTETDFLENYIALERIRIRYGVNVEFKNEVHIDVQIPPMLLIAFVENIFKHGIDKTSSENMISISITEQSGYLHFRTQNTLFTEVLVSDTGGLGLRNLKKRLDILYGNDFEMETGQSGNLFTSFLKIPI